MPISYPNNQASSQQVSPTRTPDLPLTIDLVYGVNFPLTVTGTQSQKVCNFLIPPSSSYNLSGSSYNIVVVVTHTGSLNATASLEIPGLSLAEFTNPVGMAALGEIRYYGNIPGFFNNFADPGISLEMYLSGSHANLTSSLQKVQMIFNGLQT
jgi:hypothetical protein